MSMIRCPNCQSTLKPEDRLFRCANGHTFDRSKEGYVNLLLPNKKKSLNPGDNKTMINAREAFLSQGHYDFLISAIESQVEAVTKLSDKAYLLDLGCGSGYYTRKIFKGRTLNKIGVDISKVGMAKAAKKDPNSLYIVGSIFDLPIVDNVVDIAINIFAPIQLSEIFRVCAPQGILIKVIPGTNHMKEIAGLAYKVIRPHTSSILQDIEVHEGIQLLHCTQVEKVVSLQSAQIEQLISMTPYVYKFNEEKLGLLSEMTVTLEFEVIIAKVLAN